MTKGIAITERGVDMSSAHDSQKILDSRFRYLELLIEDVITLPTLVQTSGAQVIYTHNLGFLPAFEVYDTVLQDYIEAPDAGGFGLLSSKTQLYFNSFYIDRGWSNHKVIIRIYNIPITEEYTAPIEQTLPSKAASASKQGIKILRNGSNDFTDYDLSKYSLNSRGKALAIQRHGTTLANSGTNFQAVIGHNMGLPPTYMATYADPRGQWIGAIDTSQASFKSSATTKDLIFSGAQSALIGTFAYIIFKELGDFAV